VVQVCSERTGDSKLGVTATYISKIRLPIQHVKAGTVQKIGFRTA